MSIPETITHQDKLLTVDTNASKFLEGLLHPGVKVHPMFIDPSNAMMALRVKFAPGLTLPLHFHTGYVHAYTISGCWHYEEYPEEKQTAGSYLYEPGGSVHRFMTPAGTTEDTDVIFFVTGANINFATKAEGGAYLGTMDAGWVKGWCDQAIREQGADRMKYIAASIPTFSR